MFKEIKERLDKASYNYWKFKAERYLNKIKKGKARYDYKKIDPEKFDLFYENIDITISILKNFKYPYSVFYNLSEHNDIINNRENYQKISYVLFYAGNEDLYFLRILDFCKDLDLLLNTSSNLKDESSGVYNKIVGMITAGYEVEGDKTVNTILLLQIAKLTGLKGINYIQSLGRKDTYDIELLLNIAQFSPILFSKIFYEWRAFYSIKEMVGKSEICRDNLELIFMILDNVDAESTYYTASTLRYSKFKDKQDLVDLLELLDSFKRNYSFDNNADVIKNLISVVYWLQSKEIIHNISEVKNHLEFILEIINNFRKIKSDREIGAFFKFDFIRSMSDLVLINAILKHCINDPKDSEFLLNLFDNMIKSDDTGPNILEDLGKSEGTISRLINFYKGLGLDYKIILNTLKSQTIAGYGAGMSLDNIDRLNKLLIKLKEEYPGIRSEEVANFLSSLDNLCVKILHIRFDDLLESLYLYRLAQPSSLEILSAFRRKLNLNYKQQFKITEEQSLIFEKIKLYHQTMINFIVGLINNDVITKIEDLDPDSLRLLFQKFGKVRIVRSYESLVAALNFAREKPEHAEALLRSVLIDINNQNLSTESRQDIENFLPIVLRTLDVLLNNYDRFTNESKIYLDAIIKRLNIGDINLIGHLRQLAIDLRGVCEPLAIYREDIHNSPSVIHYYIARILRTYLKNGNKDLATVLCKKYNIEFKNDIIIYHSGENGRREINLNSLDSYIRNEAVLKILLDLSIALARVYNINTKFTEETISNIENALDAENRVIIIKIRQILEEYAFYFKGKRDITTVLNKISEAKREINNLLANPNIQNKLALYRLIQLLEGKEYTIALRFKDISIRDIADLSKAVEVCLYFLNQVENHKYVKIARNSLKEFLNSKQFFQLANAVYNLNKYFIEVIEPLLIKEFRSVLEERGFDRKKVEEYLSLIIRESTLLPLYEITAKIDYYLRNLKINKEEQEAIERHQTLLRFREESREEELKRELSSYRKAN